MCERKPDIIPRDKDEVAFLDHNSPQTVSHNFSYAYITQEEGINDKRRRNQRRRNKKHEERKNEKKKITKLIRKDKKKR